MSLASVFKSFGDFWGNLGNNQSTVISRNTAPTGAFSGLNLFADTSTPDLSDYAVQQARATQLQQTLTQRGRRSTFLTGPLGDTTPAPVTQKTLLGG